MHTVDRIPREVLSSMSAARLSPTRRIPDAAIAPTLFVALAPLPAVLLPQRAALDVAFLRRATVRNVMRLITRTVVHMLSADWGRGGCRDAAGRRDGGSHGDRGGGA
jgi:hypothetical protein